MWGTIAGILVTKAEEKIGEELMKEAAKEAAKVATQSAAVYIWDETKSGERIEQAWEKLKIRERASNATASSITLTQRFMRKFF